MELQNIEQHGPNKKNTLGHCSLTRVTNIKIKLF